MTSSCSRVLSVLVAALGLTLAACNGGDKTSATSAGEPGCAGGDRAACEASTPLDPEHACYFVKTYAVTPACEVTPGTTECLEMDLIDGGASCDGFFRADAGGLLRLESLDCAEPVDGDWSLCFPEDPMTAADPVCACAIDESCTQYKDQATCEAMSTTRHPCAWQGGACDGL